MKSFEEFVNNIDPDFFESVAEKEDKKEKKEDGGKKMPPWLKGKEDKAADKGDKKCEDKCEKKNPFMKKKKD